MKLLRNVNFALFIFFIAFSSCSKSGEDDNSTQTVSSRQDSIYRSLIIDYLRKNFDDIHDVSMRFHHQDHNLNGLIVLRLSWNEGRLQSGEIVQNETGSENFAKALIEKIHNWNIPDLDNAFEMNLPLMIRIVGSDDSTFADKSILTGEVVESNGDPIRNAKIEFIHVPESQFSIPPCYSNREGIFVRTLIPPGSWNIVISCDGFETVHLNNFTFVSGEHHRQRVTMKRK